MLEIIFACAVTFVLLLVAEILKRKKHIRGELARKFVHLSVGSFVATWPFFMEWWQITLLSLAFIVVIIISRHLHIFMAIHSVKRPTWGDILFPVGIGATALITHSPWIFAAAILHLSLGDGIAAIIGQQYGKVWTYKIAGQKKSFIGSTAFLIVSFIITAWLLWATPVVIGTAPVLIVLLPMLATLLEGVSVYGIDNITVPVMVAVVLNSLQTIG